MLDFRRYAWFGGLLVTGPWMDLLPDSGASLKFHVNLELGGALLPLTPRIVVVLQLLYLYSNERKHHDQAFRRPGRRPDRHLRFRR
jgi:hypothetical protein